STYANRRKHFIQSWRLLLHIVRRSLPPRDGLGRAAVVLGRASFRARSILRLPQVRPIGIRYNGEVRPGTTDVGFQISEARPRKSVVRHGNARAARERTCGTKGHELKIE